MVREVGQEIVPVAAPGAKVGRGYIEPSLTTLDGKYYVTLRAEDGRGYVAVSEDGLKWAPQVPWSWDDGTPLEMATTQQHWIIHSDALYLAYTRKHSSNAGVFRWRTPLFITLVDRTTMRLVRSTERIAVPMLPATGKAKPPYGSNFHTTNISPDESVVTESLMHSNFSTNVFACRIRWSKPNRLMS